LSRASAPNSICRTVAPTPFWHQTILIMFSAAQFGSAVNDEVGMHACRITLLGTCFSCGDYFCYANAQHRRQPPRSLTLQSLENRHQERKNAVVAPSHCARPKAQLKDHNLPHLRIILQHLYPSRLIFHTTTNLTILRLDTTESSLLHKTHDADQNCGGQPICAKVSFSAIYSQSHDNKFSSANSSACASIGSSPPKTSWTNWSTLSAESSFVASAIAAFLRRQAL
jgi:hypothetical protein